MTSAELIKHARALYAAHGDKAEAEAAEKSLAAKTDGRAKQAESWHKIRMHIKELRGPRAT